MAVTYNHGNTFWHSSPANTVAISLETPLIFSKESSKLNVHTFVVRLKAGYVGQVLRASDRTVLWESKPQKTHEKAQHRADKAVDSVFSDLFRGADV